MKKNKIPKDFLFDNELDETFKRVQNALAHPVPAFDQRCDDYSNIYFETYNKTRNILSASASKSRNFVEKDVLNLKNEIENHKNEIDRIKKELNKEIETKGNIKEQNKHLEEEIRRLTDTFTLYEKKQKLFQLMSQVNNEAQDKLSRDDSFVEKFSHGFEFPCYVLAIDIRRSTELMLKARSPVLFEKFIVGLCEGLKESVLSNYGVFDKFTGDGILAFFPNFYSGEDAGLFVLKTAFEAHLFFDKHYKENRSCFSTVLKNVGLGIGIDYGNTNLVRINTFTVVGHPVVYACRLSGANPHQTLINQPAYDELFTKYSGFFNVEETSLNIKNEGDIVAYCITQNGREIICKEPDWITEEQIASTDEAENSPSD